MTAKYAKVPLMSGVNKCSKQEFSKGLAAAQSLTHHYSFIVCATFLHSKVICMSVCGRLLHIREACMLHVQALIYHLMAAALLRAGSCRRATRRINRQHHDRQGGGLSWQS